MESTIRLRTFEPTYGNWNAHFKSENNGNTTYKNIELVEDNSYTHALIYNLFRDTLHIPKKNIAGFITEPYELVSLQNYVPYCDVYFCHDNTHLDKSIFKNGMPFLGPICGFNQMLPWKNKPLTMSIIASDKTYLPGHSLRHEIIRRILRSNLNIDIFGRGLERMYRGDSRLKGTIDDKRLAFVDYKFNIAIENVKYHSWTTEKYYDVIKCGCIPIYWGATAINDLYSPNCHVELPNGNPDEIFAKIVDIYHNHHAYGEHNVVEGQRIIKEKQNLPEFIWRHFNGVA